VELEADLVEDLPLPHKGLMSKLDEILAYPDKWYDRGPAWKQLTTGDTLFSAIHEVVGKEIPCEWQEILENIRHWETDYFNEGLKSDCEENGLLYESENKIALQNMAIVKCLLWCGEKAVTTPNLEQTDIDPVLFALSDTTDFIKPNKSWAWITMQTLKNTPFHSTDVPVALFDQKSRQGIIATLRLESILGGSGQITHHPIDVFSPGGTGFPDSIEAAWSAALNCLNKEGTEVQHRDGRWRLLQKGKDIPFQDGVGGGSAGGAAMLGAYLAMQKKRPEKGVIVLAEVDQEMNMSSVESVAEKVKAIAKDVNFDTILVANEKNRVEAESALEQCGKKNHIRVVLCNSL